ENIMAKVRTFGAKLAHARAGKEKSVCPVCHTEIKIIKIIKNKNVRGKWTPKSEIVKLCKCNEKEVLA
ncbi:MAG: hypothetical protein U9P79_00010, partial [Candidatus Cloacimonadota bacterium]|nr:hypothetical protein [Candidatus Cloacimonadota bacterium]